MRGREERGERLIYITAEVRERKRAESEREGRESGE